MMMRKPEKDALSVLSDTERELLRLLTEENVTKDEVLAFLRRYDIDRESAESTFLLHNLVTRFGIGEDDAPAVPRIRGVAEFFRFQNATALMRLPDGETVVDTDLVLRLRFPDEVRPFPASRQPLSKGALEYLVGRPFTARLLRARVPVKLGNREVLIPGDRALPALVWISLYRAVRLGENRSGTVCYLREVYRTCGGQGPSIALRAALGKMKIRHFLGRIKRWLLHIPH